MTGNNKLVQFIKTYFFALFALVATGATLAFKPVENKTINDFEHWDFVGPGSSGIENPLDPSQYELADDAEPCLGSGKVCQILAPIDSSNPAVERPDLNAPTNESETRTVQDEIIDAQSTGDNDYVSMKSL